MDDDGWRDEWVMDGWMMTAGWIMDGQMDEWVMDGWVEWVYG